MAFMGLGWDLGWHGKQRQMRWNDEPPFYRLLYLLICICAKAARGVLLHTHKSGATPHRAFQESAAPSISSSHRKLASIQQSTDKPAKMEQVNGSAPPYKSTAWADNVGDGTPPFQSQLDSYLIFCGDQIVSPTITANIRKGFFFSADQQWTCYRRNHTDISTSFTLSSHPSTPPLFISRPGMGVSEIKDGECRFLHTLLVVRTGVVR